MILYHSWSDDSYTKYASAFKSQGVSKYDTHCEVKIELWYFTKIIMLYNLNLHKGYFQYFIYSCGAQHPPRLGLKNPKDFFQYVARSLSIKTLNLP